MPSVRFDECGGRRDTVVVFESDHELGTIRFEIPSGRYKFTPAMPKLWPIPCLVDDDPKILNARIEALVCALMEMSASLPANAGSRHAACSDLTSGSEVQDPPGD